jgi:hypothetical protein
MQVFKLTNPGWANAMILKTIDEVLENIRVELIELELEPLLEPLTYEIGVEEMSQEDYDALGEFEG